MSATTFFTSVKASAAAKPTAAELGNMVYIGRVLFQVENEVSKQHQTRREDLFFFPHGQYLTDHGLDCIILDSSQQMADLGALVKATVAVLRQVLSNGVLLNMGISILGLIPILLLATISQTGKAGFHLVGKVILMITAKVGKQETKQLVTILLLLGQCGMKPHVHLPKHFIQNIPYCHHIDAEGVAEGSILLKQCNGYRRPAWEGNMVLKDWCTSNCLGIQGWIVC
jgi:hypothetical protein